MVEFGTDGVRGVAGRDVGPDVAMRLGRAIVVVLAEEGTTRPSIVVGRDPRWSGEMLEAALVKYQDPAQADKLLKVQKELDETKIVLHKTIDSVLDRGEKLNSLVEKSTDLSMASQMFYKQARKQNQCCTLM